MSDLPTPAQVRSARGMLNWSMLDLARAAGVSVSTVKRFEGGGAQPVSRDTVAVMQRALEAAGVHFLDDDGDGPGLRLQRHRSDSMRHAGSSRETGPACKTTAG